MAAAKSRTSSCDTSERSNVLLLSAGRRVSLLRAFQEAVCLLDLRCRIVTADMNPSMSAACQLAERAVRLPHVLSSEYPEALRALCHQEGIVMVVPTIDTELPVLASLKPEFAAQGIELVVSSQELVRCCRDKRLTQDLFDSLELARPRLYAADDLRFPCFAKPIAGSMSQGIRIFQNSGEVEAAQLDLNEMLFMEVVPSQDWQEVTVDAYYDRQGELCCVVPRRRAEVRGGEVSKAWTDKSLLPFLLPSLKRVSGARGCLTVQVFAHRRTEALLGIEINARFGGGFPLTQKAGGKYPEWLLREALMGETLAYTEDWVDRLLMLRYDTEVWGRYDA